MSAELRRARTLTPSATSAGLAAHTPLQGDSRTGPGIVERFLSAVACAPDAPACQSTNAALTFGELDVRSRRLAERLVAAGVRDEDVVAIALPRDPQYAVAMLAVLRAGGACMPLDIEGPRERCAAMLHASGARVLLASARTGFDVGERMLQIDPSCDDAAPGAALSARGYDPQRLLFVIHTSGSSGAPKGVEVSEGQVLHRLLWDWDARPWAAGDVACQHASVGFVDAIAEWLSPLLCGVAVEVIPDELRTRPREMIARLAAARVSRIHLVPSLLALLLDAGPTLADALPALRLWTASGEPLAGTTVARFRRAAPHAALWNVYGATEALGATGFCVDEAYTVVPIGRPLPGTRIYLFDEHLSAVADGAPGDLYVAGNGLARGYRGDGALTRERFIDNPLFPGAGDRLYRTGDRARMRADGLIECLGRADRQVKVNGVRVELGEIEAAIASHGAVREVAVVHADGRIVAHVVANGAHALDSAALRDHARQRLPAGALPHAYALVDALPRNLHGKVDRARLAAVAHDTAAPRNALERMLCECFAEVLQRGSIGPTDDFFEQGGDSLRAVRLVGAIESATAVAIPLDALVAASTPRAIAAGLSQQWSEWTTNRITIAADGSEPPLFAVAGAWGYAIRLLAIGRNLRCGVPFHALQPPRMYWPDGTTLVAMAAHYVDEILQVRPGGPHRLFGTSFGGLMAFEIALQLKARGHAVPLLAMVDSSAPGADFTPSVLPDRALTPSEATGRRVYLAHMAAAQHYRPAARYRGRAIYLRCAQPARAALRGWRPHFEDAMEVVPVPGVHGEYHQPPQLGAIVEHVRAILSRHGAPDAPSTTPQEPPAGWHGAQTTRPPTMDGNVR